MKTYLRYIQSYKKQITILSIIYILSSLLALGFAYYSKDLIDLVLISDIDGFIFYAILLGSFLLLNVIFQTLYKYLATKYTNKVVKALKSKHFNHLLHTSAKDLASYHSGTLINHLENDIDIVSIQMTTFIPRLLFYVVRLFGAFILLMFINPLFSIIFFGLGLILFLASRLIAPIIKKRHKTLRTKIDIARSFNQESLENVAVIKTFEAEEKMTMKQQTMQDEVNNAKMKQLHLSLLTSSGMQLFFAFGYAFALIFGGYQLQFGLSVGYLIAIIQLIQQLQSPFSSLSVIYPKFQQAIASMERLDILETLQTETTKKPILKDFTSIEAKNISFKYNHKHVIKDLSFQLHKNELILIKGPSGVGKSTLIKLLLGLYDINNGKLICHMKNQSIDISNQTRSLFSYVPQDHLILSGTMRDNLNLFETHSDEKLIQVLKDVSLFDELNKEHLLDQKLGEKGIGLSIGQLQRLAIARALLKDAPILCLDEATSALDLNKEQDILNHLTKLHQKTIILISHHPLDEQLFNQIITLT